MSHEEARDGERAHLGSAADQAHQAFAKQRHFAYGICSHGSGEEGALVPGEQIAGEGHSQNESEQDASGKPEQLAAAFVGAVNICLRKM